MTSTTPFPAVPLRKLFADAAQSSIDQGHSYQSATDLFEAQFLEKLLAAKGNNQGVVAEISGLHRNTVARKLKKHGIQAQGVIERRSRRQELRTGLHVRE